MLTERVVVVLPALFRLNILGFPLLHQLFPLLLRSLQTDRKVAHGIVHAFCELLWKLAQSTVVIDFLRPPVALLRWDVGSGRDRDVWVYEEEGQNFAVAWSGYISEAEGENAVLEDVWEDEEAIFAGQDLADDLICWQRHLKCWCQLSTVQSDCMKIEWFLHSQRRLHRLVRKSVVCYGTCAVRRQDLLGS